MALSPGIDEQIRPAGAKLPVSVETVSPAFNKISATVLTHNSGRRIAEVLAALAWCDEVVVLDTGSTDNTLEIARRSPNVSVHRLREPFPGFGEAHRRATALARNDWILSIDSDEV